MKIGDIFKENVTNKEKNMTYIFLGVGLIIIILGLIKGFKHIDPKYFVMIAALIGIFISGFGIVGKLFQDIAGGIKQDKILNNTITNIEKTTQTLDKATNNFILSQKIDTTTTSTNELSILISENVQLIKSQNQKLQEYNQEIDKNILIVKKANELQAIEIEKQRFPFPEKLYLYIELSFKFSKDFDYSEVFKTYTSKLPQDIFFNSSSPSEEFKNAFIKTTENLGILQITGNINDTSILQISGNINNQSIINFYTIQPMKYSDERNVNLEDLTEFYIPKNDNSVRGDLIYIASNKEYRLKIEKYPILFYKNPKITSILDIDNCDFEIKLNFIPKVPYTNNTPFVQLTNGNDIDIMNKIVIGTDNSTIAVIQNLEIVKNSQNENSLKGKIKLTIE